LVGLVSAASRIRSASLEGRKRPAVWAGRLRHAWSSVTLRRVVRDLGADGRVRVRAAMPAAAVVHLRGLVGRWGVFVPFRCRQGARGGGEDELKSECGLGQHGTISFCSTLIQIFSDRISDRTVRSTALN